MSNERELGLGLGICKNLIEKMGGCLKFTSNSQATTFSVQMVEICRLGKDKRENFTVKEEITFDVFMKEAILLEKKDQQL